MIRAGGDEEADLADGQLTGGLGEGDRTEVDELVAAVAVELGPLVLVHGVLDGKRVQTELLRDDAEVGLVRIVQVQPDQAVGIGSQVPADVLGRESLGQQGAGSVQGLGTGGCASRTVAGLRWSRWQPSVREFRGHPGRAAARGWARPS